jgi:hypothetical protein
VRGEPVVHRPAHTVYDLCTVAEGARLGQGLHVGLTSVIGGSGRLGPLQAGGSLVGRNAVVGRPAPGTVPGARRVGQTSQVG